ncbi:MAG: DUF969 domain-containing protein [Fusobacterium sp.]|nr:DUF969 domain-containing protein [Fusobacterium sp.]
MLIKLIGVLIILIGFTLKLDTIAVVLVAGLATGLVAGMGFVEILEVLGGAFVSTRYMTLLLLTLALVGILERNGLRERAEMCISKLKGATCGKVMSVYIVIRTIAAILSLRIGGHVQFIRPLVYPMAKGAAEKEGKLSAKLDDELKGHVNAVENYGNFYGQNGFIASAGVLLIVGTLQELGITNIDAYSVAKASLIMAALSTVICIIRNYMFDMKIKRSK